MTQIAVNPHFSDFMLARHSCVKCLLRRIPFCMKFGNVVDRPAVKGFFGF